MFYNATHQVYQQIIHNSEGCFNLDKPYETKDIFGVVVLEYAVVPRKKVSNKTFEMWIEKVGRITECEMDYIHNHVLNLFH